jgi:signal transduction histidine kinase
MITVNSTLRRVGIGVALVVAVFLTMLDLVQHYRVDPPAALAFGAVWVLPLVLVLYRQPLVAWLVALNAMLVTAVLTAPGTAWGPVSPSEPWPLPVSSMGVLVVLTGLVATRGERRLNAVVLGLLAVLGLAVVLFVGGGYASLLAVAGLCAVAAAVGEMVYARRRAVTELTEERQVSAAERDRRRLVEERARIARELHDVVAHHMSMITVQAETARYRLDPLPEHVVEEFTGIAALARSSLTELRGLLSALRDETADPDLRPQPTLADLPALVERIVAAGTPVTLTVAPDLPEIPRGVALSAYRIVQEALSNVVRHAGGAPTTVEVAATRSMLTITVTNTAPPVTGAVGTGLGLRGLRERAALLGGTLEVDQPDGGWRVRAELPI